MQYYASAVTPDFVPREVTGRECLTVCALVVEAESVTEAHRRVRQWHKETARWWQLVHLTGHWFCSDKCMCRRDHPEVVAAKEVQRALVDALATV
jgi:hypothetical protein